MFSPSTLGFPRNKQLPSVTSWKEIFFSFLLSPVVLFAFVINWLSALLVRGVHFLTIPPKYVSYLHGHHFYIHFGNKITIFENRRINNDNIFVRGNIFNNVIRHVKFLCGNFYLFKILNSLYTIHVEMSIVLMKRRNAMIMCIQFLGLAKK